MTTLDKKSIKQIPVGAKIHIVGKDVDITGKVTKNDKFSISIFSSNNTLIGLPVESLATRYAFELL